MRMGLLTLILVMLRASGLVPDLPWAWAFSPLWIPLVFLLCMCIVAILLAVLEPKS